MGRLGLKVRPRTIPEKQAAAAVGQGLLMQLYESLFGARGRIVGQLLLTRDDLTHRKRHLNCRNTLHALWRMGAIPIVNENDTVAVDEIKFGDNDTLAALVASLVGADLLVILSDVEGLYDQNPKLNPDATLLSVVETITPELEQAAGGPGSALGSGGMATKIHAAKVATGSGTAMVIAHGNRPRVLHSILAGEPIGTLFMPQKEPLTGRKRWIAFHQAPMGRLLVDDGAKEAIMRFGRSLLPIGVVGVDGQFDEGDVVQIVDANHEELARGLVNYSAQELQQIRGCPSHEIESRLGHKYYDEVVHRDNLVLSR